MKKIIFSFFSIFIIFLFGINSARAEVTCCACGTLMEGHPPHFSFRGFACSEGSAEGSTDCVAICRAGNSSWVLPDASVRASGETVTCCACDAATMSASSEKICRATTDECSTICQDHGGFSQGNVWYRRPLRTTGAEETPGLLNLVPPSLLISIPGFSGFSGEQIVNENGTRYFYIPWIGQYAKALYNWVLGIVGILAVIVIVWGGVMWLTAGGSPEKIKRAQEYIVGAIAGLVIAFGSYLILYTLNPDLTRFGSMKLKVVETIALPEGAGLGTYNSVEPTAGVHASQFCRFIAPPDVFRRPRTDLNLDRINIRGENENRCPGGVIYTREIVDAVLAAQRATGIPAGFLLVQAQHETSGFREDIEAGRIPSTLWGRKCPSAPLSGAAREVYIDSQPTCNMARQPSFRSELESACRAPECQVRRTREPCSAGSSETVPTWACFTNVAGSGGIARAAMSQAEFYRDRIGRSCTHCGSLDLYEGSVMGFTARMSCSLFGGFLSSAWDNCLYMFIRLNCLEDSRNADFITLSETLGPRGGCINGVNARDPNLCADPYDSAKIANPSADWCASNR